MATLFATLSFGLTFYLNFKYGYTLPEALMSDDLIALAQRGGVDLREVRERDYFFIVSFSVWGLWAGIGLSALWQELTERFRDRRERGLDPELMAAPIMAVALLPLVLNWSWASRRGDYTARDWAYNVLMSIEPYGIVYTNGDNDTFPLWYLQEVEGIRQDVTVMVMSYLNTPWYVNQIRDLTTPCEPGVDPMVDPTRIICQRPYDLDGPEFYNQAMVPTDAPGVSLAQIPPGRRPPTESIVPLTQEQIDQVANTPPYMLEEARVYTAGGIESSLPANTVMIPADAFMASMINVAVDDRPIYFAMTTQAYEELSLRQYLIRQGVAFKLNNGPVRPDSARGIYAVPGPEASGLIGPYIDLPRTENLLSNVFLHRGGFPDEWNHWVDSATEGIPFYYAYTHYGLALVYNSLGNEQASQRHAQAGERFLRLGNRRRQE
jgi:hypothetical protein